MGIMISKTIGFRGLAYFQTNPFMISTMGGLPMLVWTLARFGSIGRPSCFRRACVCPPPISQCWRHVTVHLSVWPKNYPLVMTNIAIENGHRNSGFSHTKIVIFNSYVKLPEGKKQIYTSSIPSAIIYGAKIWIGVWKSNTDLPPIRFFTSSISVTQWVIQNRCGFPQFCWWLKGEKIHEKHPKLTCSKVGGLHHLPSSKLNSHWISGIYIYTIYI